MVAVQADQGLPGGTGQRAPGIGPDGRVVVVQTKLPLRHGDRLTYRRWDADFNNCASKGQLNGLLNNRAVPTVEAVQLSFIQGLVARAAAAHVQPGAAALSTGEHGVVLHDLPLDRYARRLGAERPVHGALMARSVGFGGTMPGMTAKIALRGGNQEAFRPRLGTGIAC